MVKNTLLGLLFANVTLVFKVWHVILNVLEKVVVMVLLVLVILDVKVHCVNCLTAQENRIVVITAHACNKEIFNFRFACVIKGLMDLTAAALSVQELPCVTIEETVLS